jgi:hypothetical protein
MVSYHLRAMMCITLLHHNAIDPVRAVSRPAGVRCLVIEMVDRSLPLAGRTRHPRPLCSSPSLPLPRRAILDDLN